MCWRTLCGTASWASCLRRLSLLWSAKSLKVLPAPDTRNMCRLSCHTLPNKSCILSDDQRLFANPAGQMHHNPAVPKPMRSSRGSSTVCHLPSGTHIIWPLMHVQSQFCIFIENDSYVKRCKMAQAASKAPVCGCSCVSVQVGS